MKFGEIMHSGSGELLTFEKIPKNPRWPPAPWRLFCTVGFSGSDAKSISSYSLHRIFLKLGTHVHWVRGHGARLADFSIFA